MESNLWHTLLSDPSSNSLAYSHVTITLVARFLFMMSSQLFFRVVIIYIGSVTSRTHIFVRWLVCLCLSVGPSWFPERVRSYTSMHCGALDITLNQAGKLHVLLSFYSYFQIFSSAQTFWSGSSSNSIDWSSSSACSAAVSATSSIASSSTASSGSTTPCSSITVPPSTIWEDY